ncbi:hypothetical protein FOA52_014588 [Chlamydomonas sp. UWO 241]|nr:hypothetical protein FOA52_014588 [Chlamydomonas sp. UWO 241]
MPGCSVWETCKVDPAGASGLFCSPVTLLATICAEMPTMRGCATYAVMCGAGSVVAQCTSQAKIPGMPTTVDAQADFMDMCMDHAMSACDLCTPVGGGCPDPLFSLSMLCTNMPGMALCAGYYDMCASSATLARTANVAAGADSSQLSRYCTETDFSADAVGTPAPRQVGTYLPTMLMYFHQRLRDIILWKGWIPQDNGAYAGSIIGILMFGIVSVGLKTWRSGLAMWWAHTDVIAVANFEHAEVVAARAARMGGHDTSQVIIQVMSAAQAHVTGAYWWMCTKQQAWQGAIKAAILGVSLTLDYFNMLIAMTFNIGLFVAVITGYMLGAFLLTHVLDNYAARLRHLKQEHHRELREADAKLATTATAAGGGGASGGGGDSGGSSSTGDGESQGGAGIGALGLNKGQCCSSYRVTSVQQDAKIHEEEQMMCPH